MPELPEVETVRTQLEKFVVGQIINNVQIKTSNVFTAKGISFTGSQIIRARRFSKLLVLDLSQGYSFAIHLKMTGKLILEDPNHSEYTSEWDIDYPTNKHTHIILTFSSGAKLYFNDYRRFGTVEILKTENLPKLRYIRNLGKEFFAGLTKEHFYTTLQSTSRAIKIVLLDQTKLAGVGNIYANEGLWLARIHPEISAKILSKQKSDILFSQLEEVMKKSLERHGASSDNFRDLFGRKGSAQNHFFVYNKENRPCPRCGTGIKKYFLGGRGTYVCPVCQPVNLT